MTQRATLFVLLGVCLARAQGPLQPAPSESGSRAAVLPLSGRAGQSGAVIATQTPLPGVTTSVNTLSTNIHVQPPFNGSVKTTDLPGGILGLSDAIKRGLEFNLGFTGSSNSVRQSRGQARVARSGLLPNINASLRDSVQQTNLAAFGFRIPFGPSIIGPFSYFDLRASLSQTIFDYTTINNYKSAKAGTEAAEQYLQDARDLVVFAVSGAYAQVIAAKARLAAVQAQVDTAALSLKQMQEQRAAGVVAPIDVNRSQVELQMEQQRLVSVQNDLAKLKINLARIIGIPSGSAYDLADDLPFAPPPELTLDQALKEARENRADLKAAGAQIKSARYALSAARAERYPSLALTGDYGVIGKNPANSHGTFTVVGSLRIPIWQGGRTEGTIAQADAALDQRLAELEDLQGRIDADIQAAFLDLDAAAKQVEVSRNNQQLARETLRLTQERFDAGITTTLEVVESQQSVSSADLDYITSVFAHNVAKINIARSLGRAEQNVKRFLRVQ